MSKFRGGKGDIDISTCALTSVRPITSPWPSPYRTVRVDPFPGRGAAVHYSHLGPRPGHHVPDEGGG